MMLKGMAFECCFSVVTNYEQDVAFAVDVLHRVGLMKLPGADVAAWPETKYVCITSLPSQIDSDMSSSPNSNLLSSRCASSPARKRALWKEGRVVVNFREGPIGALH
jgi:hypothetical protein